MPPEIDPTTGEPICPDCGEPCRNCNCAQPEQPEPCPECGGPPGECDCADYVDDESSGQEGRQEGGEWEEDHTPPECPLCSGPSTPLGNLGATHHWRCRDCGHTHFTEQAG